MFGISDVWLDTDTQVAMFDRERAVLDTFLHPRGEGPARFGELLIEEHRDDLDFEAQAIRGEIWQATRRRSYHSGPAIGDRCVPTKPLTYKHIIERARGKGSLLHDAIIKDHILSYLLAGIAATPGLGDRLAFKGGTALRKCWFPRYRYSEDLDFTLIDGAPIETDELVGLMKSAGEPAVQLVPDYGARYRFDVRTTAPREPHPFGQANLRLAGKAPSGAAVTIKVEITGTDEPVLLPTDERRVLHSFPEDFDAAIRCYALEEIAVEKVRAGLQVRDRLNRFEEQGRRDMHTASETCTTSGSFEPTLMPNWIGPWSGASSRRRPEPGIYAGTQPTISGMSG
jgi:predicted nucleotidyltransferase component of viral defense system